MGRKPRTGWVSWAGGTNPLSPASRPGEHCELLPSGVRGGALAAERFPLFSALRMASPDTIILLIVDYHAATGVPPPALRTPQNQLHH